MYPLLTQWGGGGGRTGGLAPTPTTPQTLSWACVVHCPPPPRRLSILSPWILDFRIHGIAQYSFFLVFAISMTILGCVCVKHIECLFQAAF